MIINKSEYYQIMSQVTEKVNPESLVPDHYYRGLTKGGCYDLFMWIRMITNTDIVASYLIISFDGIEEIFSPTTFEKDGFKFFKLTKDQHELFRNILIDETINVINDVAV